MKLPVLDVNIFIFIYILFITLIHSIYCSLKLTNNNNIRHISKSGYDITPWNQDKLSHELSKLKILYNQNNIEDILLHKKTEMSYTGRFLDGQRYNIKDKGIYVCALSNLPLFKSEHKFTSGTGWPSFYEVYDYDHIIEDIRYEMKGYTEIRCKITGYHIGHAYIDKPSPQLRQQFERNPEEFKYLQKFHFIRYCVNASVLKFIPDKT